MNQLTHVFGGSHSLTSSLNGANADGSYAQLYEMLWALYWSDIYQDLDKWHSALGIHPETNVHAIRNPTMRVTEYYSAHMWPGTLPDALPIETDTEKLPDAIHHLWRWSNWGSQKQAVARTFPLLGDWFIKVPQREDDQRPYIQTIDPAHVIDHDVDERGNVIWIRIDVPQKERRENGKIRRFFYIEVWDKASGRFRVWRHDRAGVPIDQLGTPETDEDIGSFGIDFVPFVHGKFRDIGGPRGVSAITLTFRKIAEADLIATALHERLFRYGKADWVLSSAGRDASGRMIPPPDVDFNEEDQGKVNVSGETLYSLPGGWDISSLIANIPYADALRILQDHMAELENDLPELAYYNLRDFGSGISGRAIRLMLSDAISRLLEARGNAETALVKAQKMALTMGQNAKLPDFANIGTFEAGDFEHQFKHREVIDLPEAEVAETAHREELAKALLLKRGVSQRHLLREDGFTDEEIDEMADHNDVTGSGFGSALADLFDAGEAT